MRVIRLPLSLRLTRRSNRSTTSPSPVPVAQFQRTLAPLAKALVILLLICRRRRLVSDAVARTVLGRVVGTGHPDRRHGNDRQNQADQQDVADDMRRARAAGLVG